MDNDNDEQRTEQADSGNPNGDGLNKPVNVRIRHYPDHEGYPDNGEDAVAIVQMASELLAGCDWEGENIPVGLQTDDGFYRMALMPEFIDELRKSQYWDTITAQLDEQDERLTEDSK